MRNIRPEKKRRTRNPNAVYGAGRLLYIDSPEFHLPDAEAVIMRPVPSVPTAAVPCLGNDPYQAFVDAVEPLSAEQQRDCFRMMNYLKFKAAATNDPGEAERLLVEARRVRDVLLVCNQRILRMFLKPVLKRLLPSESVLDVIQSGNVSLAICVDRYDYTSGFKFGTYAGLGISRHGNQSITDERKAVSRNCQFSDERFRADQLPGRDLVEPGEAMSDRFQVAELLSVIDGRLRDVVESRFGLNGTRETIYEIGERLGISGQRVSQLVKRGLAAIRDAEYRNRQNGRGSRRGQLTPSVSAMMPASGSDGTAVESAGRKGRRAKATETPSSRLPAWLVEAWELSPIGIGYESLGHRFRERERVSRLVSRWQRDFKARTDIERRAILVALLKAESESRLPSSQPVMRSPSSKPTSLQAQSLNG